MRLRAKNFSLFFFPRPIAFNSGGFRVHGRASVCCRGRVLPFCTDAKKGFTKRIRSASVIQVDVHYRFGCSPTPPHSSEENNEFYSTRLLLTRKYSVDRVAGLCRGISRFLYRGKPVAKNCGKGGNVFARYLKASYQLLISTRYICRDWSGDWRKLLAQIG